MWTSITIFRYVEPFVQPLAVDRPTVMQIRQNQRLEGKRSEM